MKHPKKLFLFASLLLFTITNCSAVLDDDDTPPPGMQKRREIRGQILHPTRTAFAPNPYAQTEPPDFAIVWRHFAKRAGRHCQDIISLIRSNPEMKPFFIPEAAYIFLNVMKQIELTRSETPYFSSCGLGSSNTIQCARRLISLWGPEIGKFFSPGQLLEMTKSVRPDIANMVFGNSNIAATLGYDFITPLTANYYLNHREEGELFREFPSVCKLIQLKIKENKWPRIEEGIRVVEFAIENGNDKTGILRQWLEAQEDLSENPEVALAAEEMRRFSSWLKTEISSDREEGGGEDENENPSGEKRILYCFDSLRKFYKLHQKRLREIATLEMREEEKELFRNSDSFRYKTAGSDRARLQIWLEREGKTELSERDQNRYSAWCRNREQDFLTWQTRVKRYYDTEEDFLAWQTELQQLIV